MKHFIAFTLLLLVFCGCGIGLGENNEKLLKGNWQAISWTNANNKTLEETKNVKFSFENGSYSYINNTINEMGTYKVENDMLFTKPSKENEMMVKIVKITKDSLILGMNRAGELELLSLVKDTITNSKAH